ncbi:MAG: triphosphoribosyl-dephospho-CoA synthase [Planctomycetota bacterium]|nr:triphosphoribosyl-dephospho-CoA synthase [Planctomycetota bacterium]
MAMSVGDRVRIAIETECSSIKAGNVHPHASFHDLTHEHFRVAAKAIGRAIDEHVEESVGQIVLKSVKAMMESAGTNTSLGTILLMAPLTVAANRLGNDECGFTHALKGQVRDVLAALVPEDSAAIYEAIRIAKPGGLGDSKSMDVRESAPESILDAMRTAAEWDDIAFQYVSDFELVFSLSERMKTREFSGGQSKLDAIRYLQMELLSERVDSLIARKNGLDFAMEVKKKAGEVIAAGAFGSDEYERAWHAFDLFLRDTSHRGNPGTIADLIAASLF